MYTYALHVHIYIQKASNKNYQNIPNSYKKYRNKITELLRISGQTYYQKYFEKNKKNSKRIWQGIHEIISSRKSKKDSSISTIIVDGNTIT